MSASRCTSSPVTVPSRRAVMVMSWIWSRPWWADISDSERVSVYLAGLPSRRATRVVITSSGVTCSLPPKPPPTSGATTRTLCSGTSRVSASMVRRMCGIWVADHMVKPSPIGCTTVERGSMKAGMSRCWRNRRRTVTSASASACSIGWPVPAAPDSKVQVNERLELVCACTRSAPSASALGMSSTTGSGSYSTSIASSASWALALSRAAITATASPTWLTVSTARLGWPGFTMSGVTGQAHGMVPWVSAKSRPEKAATTPGRLSAGETSIELIRACAIGLRRIARCSMPGRLMLSVQVVAPVIRCRSSLRRRALPTSPAAARSSTAVMPRLLAGRRLAVTGRPVIARPAACTAATMF